MILYLAADLIWATKIKGTAEALGIPCRPARTVEMLEARLADCDVRAVIVDLDVPDAALALIARTIRARQEGKSIRILAWGPHVETELFERARECGADEVMTRGALDRRMGEVLRGLAS